MNSREIGHDVVPGAASQAGDDEQSPSEDGVEVLRAVWAATGQGSADLADSFGTERSCKNMANVGFDGLAGADGDLRSAWRAKLEREGKLGRGAGSVRDIVLGQAES